MKHLLLAAILLAASSTQAAEYYNNCALKATTQAHYMIPKGTKMMHCPLKRPMSKLNLLLAGREYSGCTRPKVYRRGNQAQVRSVCDSIVWSTIFTQPRAGRNTN